MSVCSIAQQVSTSSVDSALGSAGFRNFCGMDHLLKDFRADPSFVAAEKKMNDAIFTFITSDRRIRVNAPLPAVPVVLPVVVHIINDNPDVITQAMVDAGIQDLNDAFSKSGAYAASGGVDTKLRFVLAKRDPDGGLTRGITRTKTSYGANLNMYTEDFRMKNLMNWDPAKYINIWLVNNIIGEISASFSCGVGWRRKNVGGYASMPINQPFTYGITDGMVVPGFGVVLAHEMGHYLVLYHTFEGGCTNNNCLTDGDRVCDTPPDATDDPVTDCNNPGNSCRTDTLSAYSNGFFPRDTTDQASNFMDYNKALCQNQFTQGQAERMHAALATQRPTLINNAITAPCNSALRASFSRTVADPKPTESIAFANTSIGATGGAVYEWKVDGIVVHNGLTLPARTFPDAAFPYFKKHTVTLKVTDGGCVSSSTDYIVTNCGLTARFYNNKKFIASLSGVLTDTILFTNNTISTLTGTPTYEWILNNFGNNTRSIISTNAAGAGGPNDLNYEFPAFGNFQIRLKATLGACVDSSEALFLNIANPRPDAFISIISANCFQNTKVRVNFYMCNFGYDTIMPGVPVTFYDDDPVKATARKIGKTFILPDSIKGFCCSKVYVDTLDLGYEKLDKIYAVVNNSTSSVPIVLPDPGVTLIEKEYTNNKASYLGFRYKATITPLTASMAPGDTLQLRAQASPDPTSTYTWGPPGNFSCTTCNPTFYYADTNALATKYIIAKSTYQCTDTAYIDISVPPYNDYSVGIGAVSCSPKEDSLFVDFTIYNLFKRGIIPKNLELAFYKDDPRTSKAVLLAPPFKVPDSVTARQKTYRYKIKKLRGGKVYASVNDKGTAIPVVAANAPFAESVYTNNFDSAAYTPIAGITVDTAICSGLNFKGHTISGVYRDTVLSVGGCDSTNVINLTIKPVAAVQTTINATICEGENYAGRTTTGTYVDIYPGSNTCDSVRTLNLIVNPVVRITRNIKICRGKSFFVAGKLQTVSGTYIDSAKSAKGCDSIVTTNLTVDPFVPVQYSRTICRGARFFAGGKMQTESGVYTDTTTSSAGCDSVTVTTLLVQPIIRATYPVSICRGGSYFAGGKLQTQSGLYADTVKTAGGCDSVTVTQLIVNALPTQFLPADTTICMEREFTISLTGYKSIVWSTGSSNPSITVTQPGTYSAQVVDKNGCAGSDAINIAYVKCIDIQVPSAFTPNNDGKNDVFRPLLGVPPKNYTMQIYSRWGQLVFETHDPLKGWNGKLNGEQQESGTYIYLITLIDPDGELVVKKGTLVLIR